MPKVEPAAFEYSLEITYTDPRAPEECRTLGGGVGNLSIDDVEVKNVFSMWQNSHEGCKATRVLLVRITRDGRQETVRNVDWVIPAAN